jgi:hypothetical protein
MEVDAGGTLNGNNTADSSEAPKASAKKVPTALEATLDAVINEGSAAASQKTPPPKSRGKIKPQEPDSEETFNYSFLPGNTYEDLIVFGDKIKWKVTSSGEKMPLYNNTTIEFWYSIPTVFKIGQLQSEYSPGIITVGIQSETFFVVGIQSQYSRIVSGYEA